MQNRIQIHGVIRPAAWKMWLYGATYGSAVAGNGEAKSLYHHLPAVLSKRVRCGSAQQWHMARRILAADHYWCRMVGRLHSTRVLPDRTMHNMLTCLPPDIAVSGKEQAVYACRQYWVCPACLCRQLFKFYMFLTDVVQPAHRLLSYTITAVDDNSRVVTERTVNTLNKLMHDMYFNRMLNWDHAVALAMPYYVPDNDYTDSRWRVTLRILALMDPNTAFKFEGRSHCIRQGIRYNGETQSLGLSTPENIVQALSTVFKYPAALLWQTTPAEDLAQVYTAFRGDGKQPVCRARMYGARLSQRTEEKYLNDDYKQRDSWRSAFETANVGKPAGDKRGRVQLPIADREILRREPVVAGIDR